MSNQGTFIFGMLAGAGAMYLLDPDRGRRRRALVRDQVVHGAHELGELGDAASGRARDLRNRAVGAVHETRARMRSETVDDPVLEARVRTELGRLSSSPALIDVSADHGRVVLRGRVSGRELADLLAGVESVRGVDEVVSRLEVGEGSTDGPGMRGTSA